MFSWWLVVVSIRFLAGKPVSELTPEDIRLLRRINAGRSPRALAIDLRVNARVPKYVGTWLRHPGRYDIPGVDTASVVGGRRYGRVLHTRFFEDVRRVVEKLFGTRLMVRRYRGVPILISEDRMVAVSPVPAHMLLREGYRAKRVRQPLLTRFTTTYAYVGKRRRLQYPRKTSELLMRLARFRPRLVAYMKGDEAGPLEIILHNGKRRAYVIIAPKKRK